MQGVPTTYPAPRFINFWLDSLLDEYLMKLQISPFVSPETSMKLNDKNEHFAEYLFINTILRRTTHTQDEVIYHFLGNSLPEELFI